MIKFQWPYLAILFLVPFIMYLIKSKFKNNNIKSESSADIAVKLPFYQELIRNINHQKINTKKSYFKIELILLILTWIFVILAIMRPTWYGEPQAIEQKGRDIMLAVDISGSMEANDMTRNPQITRLDIVKKIAGEFIDKRQKDRLGLVLFGSQAFLHTPLTFDHKTVKKLLNDSLIGFAGNYTAIGDAIAMSVKYLKGNKSVLILLSDGSNTSGSVQPLEAAKLAKEFDIKVYTIGIGPDAKSNPFFGNDNDLDESTLKSIANITGGEYFRATNPDSLKNIYNQINKLEPELKDSKMFTPEKELFYVPLSISFIFCSFFMILNLIKNSYFNLFSITSLKSQRKENFNQ